MTRLFLSPLGLAVALCAVASPAAAEKKPEASARAVAKQLRANLTPTPGKEWDEFQLRVVDAIGTEKHATAAGWEIWACGKPTPYAIITRSFLQDLDGDENALALLLSRELARLALGIVAPPGAGAAKAGEAEADLFAVQLMLRSGYSVAKGLAGMNKVPAKNISAWPGRASHLVEKNELELWRLTPAYQIGLYLQAIEHHETALAFFRSVTNEFPFSGEACGLRGYCELCRFFDLYAADGNSDYIKGHPLGLPYSKRTRIRPRCFSSKYWLDAVGTLKEADRLKPGQPAVLANLGLAYLIDPSEESFDLAERYLTAAKKALKAQAVPSTAGEVELLVNLAIVQIARRKPAEARKRLDEAEALAGKLPDGPRSEYVNAIAFNRALLLADEAKPQAAQALFERYLKATPRYVPWWSNAYERYRTQCDKAETKPDSRDGLQKISDRSRQSVTLTAEWPVTPGDDIDPLLNKLPRPLLRLIPFTALSWSLFPAQGVELLCSDEVVVVMLMNSKPWLSWPKPTAAGLPKRAQVGMTRAAVEALPSGAEFTSQPFGPWGGKCAYYPAWGMALIYYGDGPKTKVVRIIVGTP